MRRLVAKLTFLHHLTFGKITASLSPHLEYIPPSITCGHHLKIKKPSLKYLKNSHNFITRTAAKWNTFPESVLAGVAATNNNIISSRISKLFLQI